MKELQEISETQMVLDLEGRTLTIKCGNTGEVRIVNEEMMDRVGPIVLRPGRRCHGTPPVVEAFGLVRRLLAAFVQWAMGTRKSLYQAVKDEISAPRHAVGTMSQSGRIFIGTGDVYEEDAKAK